MIGTVLNNTYRLERALTEGGMGQVFIASHLRIKGRKYAIKQLRPELAAAPNFQTRFQVEAEVMMELEHPHIVRIEDFLVQDNSYYLVMEFIEGSTLDGHLATHGAMPIDEVHRLAIELLSGLAYCHQKGVIHRDLKPSNLLLTHSGSLKMTDFGIALQENTDKRLTRTGTILGTPDYMSPEQIMSYPLDGRSDIYSTGIILYEMAAGLPPFLRSHDTGGSYQILFAHVHRPPPDLDKAKIPSYLRSAIAKSIEKDPAHRFGSAEEMLEFLENARAEEGLPPVLHGIDQHRSPSMAAAAFVEGERPQPPGPAGSQDAISLGSAQSLDAAPAAPKPISAPHDDPGFKETAPTPANEQTSSMSQVAAGNESPKNTRRRWPAFLSLAFLAGVGAMLAWWMIEPESFAQMQKWVEQKTGFKAPLPSYARPHVPRRVEILTPRRRPENARTHAPDVRGNARDRVPPRRGDTPTPGPTRRPDARGPQTRRAVVERRDPVARPTPRPKTQERILARQQPPSRRRDAGHGGLDVPWPMPDAPDVRRATPPRRRGTPAPRRQVADARTRPVPPRTRARQLPTSPRITPTPRRRDVVARTPAPRTVPRKGTDKPPVRRGDPRPTTRQPGVDVPHWLAPLPDGRQPVRRQPPARPDATPPVKRRQQPPTRRDPAPLRRDPAPIRRAPAPLRRDSAPVRRDPMPLRRDPAPTRRDPAPVRRDPAPVRRDPAPLRRDPAPLRRDPAPLRRDPAPVRRDPVPLRRNIPPLRRDPAPLHRDPAPLRRPPVRVKPRVVPGWGDLFPPKRRVAPQKRWPLAVSAQCEKLLKLCVRTCLKQRTLVTPSFHLHCQQACWRNRIIRYKDQTICPPDPARSPMPQSAPSRPAPPPRRIAL